MSEKLLMGVDIGTNSSKGVLVTPDGEIVAQHVVPHDMDVPRPGWAEQDADGVWWTDFVRISRALLATSDRRGREIGGVGVSAIGPCLLPVDAHNRPLRPGILYGIDTRATEEIALLDDRYGSQAMYDLGGSTLSSQTVGPKILWLRRHQPEIYAQAAYFHSANDYIVLRLTGQHVIDMYTASLCNPLFSIDEQRWDETFSEQIVDTGHLPRPAWATEIAGEVTREAAEETGLEPGTPVIVGTVDAVAEAISVGAVQPGDLMCMYGSTTFLILASDRVKRSETMWAVCHGLPGLFGMAAGMSTTGSLTRWFLDNFARELLHAETDGEAYEILAHEASLVQPGSLGLVMLPYFSGERTPINDPMARGTVCGLTLAHRREHVYRALLESVAYGIADNLQTMAAAGNRPRRIVAVGGGTKNETWLQIVSDVSALPQLLPAVTIGASYGDALLAGVGTGLLPPADQALPQWVRIDHTVDPDMGRHALYQEYFQIYKDLYRHSAAEQHELARLGQSEGQ
jgi:xylulokinase